MQVIKQKYPEKISLNYEHYPLTKHEFAFEAAIAAECARNQNKFMQYHNLLFARQSTLANIEHLSLAKEAKVKDLELFNRCINDQRTGPILQSGMTLAKRLEINSIPTFIINGKLITGALSENELEEMILSISKDINIDSQEK